jgi:hypothetical protein
MMSASVENPPDCLMWMQAFDAKYYGVGRFGKEHWDQLLGHCQAVCDWPAVAFSHELLEVYPDAKVVLPGRDVDSWHASVMQTVWWRANDIELRLAARVDWAASMYRPMLCRFFETFFEGDFPGRGRDIYRSHYAQMRQLVPPERLLEYHVSQGWAPLCQFLDVQEPKEAFPSSNDAESFRSRCRSRNHRQLANAALRYALIGLGSWVVWEMAFAILSGLDRGGLL